jgi:hypothetical protein
MNATTALVIVVIVVVVIIGIASIVSEIARRRAARSRQRFGSEHERQVEQAAQRWAAETSEQQRERLHLRTLPAERRERYRQEWNGIQQRFVEVPGQAVQDADQLVQSIMRDIGYPIDDFEHRAADVSVDHPGVVRHYRAAHSVALTQRRWQAETEPRELREAAGEYRVLVDELLEGER